MFASSTLLAVLNDLMFTVKIQDAAKRAGLEAVFVDSQTAAFTKAREKPAVIILDLNYAAGAPLETIVALKTDEVTKTIELIGFVSHVQTELRRAAEEKGCDMVVARSAFSQNLPSLLSRYTKAQF